MADHRAQQPDLISTNPYPHPPFNQFQLQNPHVAGDYQEGIYQEGVPQPLVVRGEMQYPPHFDAPNYNARYYHPPSPPVLPGPHVHMMYQDGRVAKPVQAQGHHFAPEPPAQENNDGYQPPSPPYPPVPQVPYAQMYRDGRATEPVPAQAHLYALGVRDNYDGYGGHFQASDPPDAFYGARPYPAPPVDMPPPENGLRNLIGQFLYNPGTLINRLRIEPGPNGRFEVWVALELADIF